MSRMFSALSVALLSLGLVVTAAHEGHAVLTDVDICPGTGLECVISKKLLISDPGGIDITHPLPAGSPPLTLHVVSTGELAATPSIPLTIKAGGIIVDQGGTITGNVGAGTGNSLNLIASGTLTILGKIEASGVKVNGSGGDGGAITITTPGSCEISGKVIANGTPISSVGGNGGDISLQCGSIDLSGGGLVQADASGPGATGGNISLASTANGLNLSKGSKLSAVGSALDGGSISLSTDTLDPTDGCTLNGKIVLDAKNLAKVGGTGGNLDVQCGGSLNVDGSASISLLGAEGGGSVTMFCGMNLSVATGSVIKANGSDGSGGSVDFAAGQGARIAGKIEAKSAGIFGNDGEISVINGGDLTIAKGAVLNASSGRTDQTAGQITLAGGTASPGVSPVLKIEKGAALTLNGHGAGLGSLDVDISGSTCTLDGKIKSDAKVGDGAAVSFACDNVSFEIGSLIQASSKADKSLPGGAAGGTLTVDTTGSGGTPGSCTLGGNIKLKSASSSFVDPVTSLPRMAPGRGGAMVATCGTGLSLLDSGKIEVGATGPQSVGGQVTFSAVKSIDVQGSISAKATGSQSSGGSLALVSQDVSFDAVSGKNIDVTAQTGGTIQVVASSALALHGVVDIAKQFNAAGSAFGGTVLITGCNVSVEQSGWLKADGPAGINQIRAGKHVQIDGKMTAINGSNHLSLNPPTTTGIKPTAKVDLTRPVCP